jgi:hypothetical protein
MASLYLDPTWGWRTSSTPRALVRLSAVQLLGCASAGESLAVAIIATLCSR